jgi:hypothetical protein
MNFYIFSNKTLNIESMITDIVINIVIGAIIGSAVAFVNRKMN